MAIYKPKKRRIFRKKQKRPCMLCEHYYDQLKKSNKKLKKNECIFCEKCGHHKYEFIFSIERMKKVIKYDLMTEVDIYYVFKREAKRSFSKLYDKLRYESNPEVFKDTYSNTCGDTMESEIFS